ncbi:MAG: trimeric intracellular cation channel family protein [Acidithiobacillus sp.]
MSDPSMQTIPASFFLIQLLNGSGLLAFAISGAMLGVRKEFDLFGVIVLAVVTAVSGGILRDVLIGAVPPESIKDWHGVALALMAGLLSFRFHHSLERLRHPVLLFDAAGLGVFAAAGAQKALEFGLDPFMAAILGVISGIGGGMVRDILCAQVPVVLRAEIYASAAFVGALVVVAGERLGVPALEALLLGAGLTFFLRMMALYRNWALPKARRSAQE